MNNMTYNLRSQSGQAVMTVVVLALFISLTGFIGFSQMALSESRASYQIYTSEKSYFLSEAGSEDLMYRIKNNLSYTSPETIGLDGGTTTVTVTIIGQSREIVSSSSVSGYVRKSKAVLQVGEGTIFSYGVQSGKGGFWMENNSTLNGSVYTSGDIWGDNTPTITGDAFAASTSRIYDMPVIQGNARAHSIENSVISKNATTTTSIVSSTIGRHAYAEKIGHSTIGWNAYYTNLIGSSTVGWSQFSGFPQPADLPIIDFPIPDSQILLWEEAAEAGGVHTSPCPYTISSGTTTIGPLKINCDLTISNTAGVVMTGPIWVSGDFSIKNSAIVAVDPSYGAQSEALVVDNATNRLTSSKGTIENSSKLVGSGTTGSYLIMVSMNSSTESGGGEVAIEPKNNNNGSIYYAPHGEILLQNSTAIKEATAYRIHMKNSASVTYETGLNNVEFSVGPQGGYVIERWHEVE